MPHGNRNLIPIFGSLETLLQFWSRWSSPPLMGLAPDLTCSGIAEIAVDRGEYHIQGGPGGFFINSHPARGSARGKALRDGDPGNKEMGFNKVPMPGSPPPGRRVPGYPQVHHTWKNYIR